MPDPLLLDACVVINLRAGGILPDVARALNLRLQLVEQVAAESLYLQDPDGHREAIDVAELERERHVEVFGLTGVDELGTFLSFVPRLGDGEAATLAAATHRRLRVATDDRLALRTAEEQQPPIATITTPELVRRWADRAAVPSQRIQEVLRAIRDRASFVAPTSDAQHCWWHERL
jgi:hypothetical protein